MAETGWRVFFLPERPPRHPAETGQTERAVVWSASYTAFGQATLEIQEIPNNLRFPGQYADAETGVHYNWFRYYAPEIGRYLRTDPIRLEGGDVNWYGYVWNNSINLTDPFGLQVGLTPIHWRLIKILPKNEDNNTAYSDSYLCNAACSTTCWAVGGAICAVVSTSCTVGSVVTVGGLSIPCTAAIITACTASGGASNVCALARTDICGDNPPCEPTPTPTPPPAFTPPPTPMPPVIILNPDGTPGIFFDPNTGCALINGGWTCQPSSTPKIGE